MQCVLYNDGSAEESFRIDSITEFYVLAKSYLQDEGDYEEVSLEEVEEDPEDGELFWSTSRTVKPSEITKIDKKIEETALREIGDIVNLVRTAGLNMTSFKEAVGQLLG